MDMADQVGWIVGEEDGHYIYACAAHTPEERKEPASVVLRDEAESDGATCLECGLELAEAEGMP